MVHKVPTVEQERLFGSCGKQIPRQFLEILVYFDKEQMPEE